LKTLNSIPHISIIITSYNYESFICDAVDSCFVSGQNLKKEIIVIDDGSTDKTLDKLKKYKDKIKVIEKKNEGLEKAVNLGITTSNGLYWVRLDADDYFTDNYFEIVSEYLHLDYSFYYGDHFLVDKNKNYLKTIVMPDCDVQTIRSMGDFLPGAVIYKKDIVNIIGLYNEKFKNSGYENYDYILRIIEKNYKGLKINKPLLNYRMHNNNMSKNRNVNNRFIDHLVDRFNLDKNIFYKKF